MKCHEIIIKSKNKNYLVTVAIGGNFYLDWKKYAFPLWKKYCLRNKIGLIVIKKDLISKNSEYWKKRQWQKMLVGAYLLKSGVLIKNICSIDTDILINPFAPNIFKQHNENKISIISESFNMPYNLELVRKKVSFYRNKYYSKKYPLDSSIFMSVKNKYLYHKLKPQNDYACTGVIVFNTKKFSGLMEKWFFKYKGNQNTLTGGGEEPIWNYEILKTKKVKKLDYRFQALWFYEMALNYPFLYEQKSKKNNILKMCIESSLMNNYFLHFPGSWHEGKMWKIKGILQNKKNNKTLKNFSRYLNTKVHGKPVGRILPK